MKQVEYWVILSLVVTCWGIDGHTTLHLERRTVIPNLLHIAMRHLIDGVEVTTVAFLVRQDKNIGFRSDVTSDIDASRIHNLHTIQDEIIRIKLRRKISAGKAPYSLVILHQVCHSRCIILSHRGINLLGRQEVARNLHFLCIGSLETEGYCMVGVYLWRYHRYVVEQSLLCKAAHTQEQGCCYKCYLFHCDVV